MTIIFLDRASFHRKKKLLLIAKRACVGLLFLSAYLSVLTELSVGGQIWCVLYLI